MADIQPPEIDAYNEAMLSAAVRLYDRISEILVEGFGIYVTDVDPEITALHNALATLGRVLVANHRPILYNAINQQIDEGPLHDD